MSMSPLGPLEVHHCPHSAPHHTGCVGEPTLKTVEGGDFRLIPSHICPYSFISICKLLRFVIGGSWSLYENSVIGASFTYISFARKRGTSPWVSVHRRVMHKSLPTLEQFHHPTKDPRALISSPPGPFPTHAAPGLVNH